MVQLSPHIALDVTDRESAAEFYNEVLDMSIDREDDHETQLSCDNGTFYVQEASESRTYLEFQTDDLESLVDELADAECEIRAVETPEGETSYLVTDPYGCHFHVFQSE